MFEKFTSLDSGDFRQRYQGTYGFFVNGDKKVLTRLDKVTTDSGGQHGNGTVEFSDKEGLKYLLKSDTTKEGLGFEFLPPKCAFYNTEKGTPLLVSRVPARQYLRGICDRNTSIVGLEKNAYPVNFDTLLQIFDSQVGVHQALAAARKSKDPGRGIAMSRQFALSMNAGTLHCFDQIVGTFSHIEESNEYVVELGSPELWRQEVTDAFRRVNLKVSFK